MCELDKQITKILLDLGFRPTTKIYYIARDSVKLCLKDPHYMYEGNEIVDILKPKYHLTLKCTCKYYSEVIKDGLRNNLPAYRKYINPRLKENSKLVPLELISEIAEYIKYRQYISS